MLPGMTGIVGAHVAPPPASFVFSGAGAGVGQVLERVNSTSSPETKTMTFSCWSKVDTYKTQTSIQVFYNLWAYTSNELCYAYLSNSANRSVIALHQDVPYTTDYSYEEGGTSSSTSWRHLVYRYDYTNGTAANRVRIYENGTQITPSFEVNPSTSRNIPLLQNGQTLNIGSEALSDGRIAFPELVVGQSLDPSSFAFNDGGTWTAKKYTGSYGTYGFRLDGTGGANGCNDVSGNGMNFTPTNWNPSTNLDYAELPPRNF